ncbi:hypothetical protein CR513_27828, partial [Mucuna pruriens]
MRNFDFALLCWKLQVEKKSSKGDLCQISKATRLVETKINQTVLGSTQTFPVEAVDSHGKKRKAPLFTTEETSRQRKEKGVAFILKEETSQDQSRDTTIPSVKGDPKLRVNPSPSTPTTFFSQGQALGSRSSNSLHSFDPELDKTLNRIRKAKNIHVGHSSSSFNSISKADICEYKPEIANNPLYESELMENNNRTSKELATPNVLYQPWCIQYPQLEPPHSYVLKSEFIHLMPKFHDLAGEDSHKYLKEFHVACSMMRPQGIPEDYIKMKAFLFLLEGAVKD